MSYANQVRLLKLSVQELGTTMGQGLIAAIRPALVALNTFMNYVIAAARAFRTFMYTIFGKPESFGGGVVNEFAEVADAGADLADSTGGGGGGAAGNLADAAKSAKKLKKELTVLPFDELNQLAKDKDSAGSSSPSGGGGGGGAGGGGGLGDFGLDEGMVDIDELLQTNKLAEGISKWGQMIRKAFDAKDWVGLGKAMTWGFNTGLKGLYEALDPGKVRMKVLPFIQAFTKTFNSFTQYFDSRMLGKTIGRAINDAVWIANTFITNINFQNIGRKIAIMLNGMVTEIDWTALGEFFANKFMILWNTAYGFVTTFDWRTLGTELGNGINGFINDVDWATIAQTIGGFVVGALNSLATFIETVDWYGIGESVKEFLVNIDWAGVVQELFEAITAAAAGLGEFIAGLLTDGFQAAIETITDPIDECGGNVIAGLLAGMASALDGIATWIGDNIFSPILNGIKSAFGINSPAETMKEPGGFILEGLLQGITDKMADLPTFFGNVKQGFLDALSGAGQWLVDKGSAVAGGLQSGWNTGKQAVLGAVGGIGGEISKGVGNLSKTGKNIADDFGSGFGGIKKSTSSTLSDAVKEIKTNINIMQTEGLASANGFTQGFNRGLSAKMLSATINSAFRSIFNVLNTNKNTLATKGKDAGSAYTKGFSSGFNEKAMSSEAIRAITAITNTLKNSKGSFEGAGRELGNAFGNAFNTYSRAAVKVPKLTQNGTYYDAKTKTKIPTYQIEWHAEGGLFTRATVLNGFGEAGDEAAIPLTNKRAMRRIANAIVDSSDNFGMNPMMLAEAVEYGVANALAGQGLGEDRPIVVPVMLDSQVIARAVSKGQQKLDRRYRPSTGMGY